MINNNIFLTGSILREVKNGRLNCNNADNEQFKGSAENGSYVKKIRRGKDVLPYASTQNQKKAIKEFARSQGFNIAKVIATSSKSVTDEGSPYSNYDEDVMGFLKAEKITLTQEQYNELDEASRVGYLKKGKKGYEKNITKKRRAKLMMSPLQAIGHTRITSEFSTRQTNETPLLYTKEVYSTNMSTSFILDVANISEFNANDNVADYRDYTLQDARSILDRDIEDKEVEFGLGLEEKLKRVNVTLDALRVCNSVTTMTNNLEDLSAKFVILANYNIGSAIFNNIFEDNRLKIDYLKQAIEENEEYRISDKIYIGCRDEFFKQDERFLIDILRLEFENDDRFVIGGVKEVIEMCKDDIENIIK